MAGVEQLTFPERAVKVIRSPDKFFSLLKSGSVKGASLYYLSIVSISVFFSSFFGSLGSIHNLFFASRWDGLGINIYGIFANAIMTSFAGLLSAVVGAALVAFFGKKWDGKGGFRLAFQAITYSVTPLILSGPLGAILILMPTAGTSIGGLVTSFGGFYTLYLAIKGTRIVQALPPWKAAVLVFLFGSASTLTPTVSGFLFGHFSARLLQIAGVFL